MLGNTNAEQCYLMLSNPNHTSQNEIYINLNSERVIAVWKFSKGYELIIMGVKTEIERRIVEKCPF